MPYFNIVAQTSENTVVTEYEPVKARSDSYQSEAELEREFIRMLTEQGYEYLPIHSEAELIANLRKKLEILKDPHIGAFAVIQTLVCAAVYGSGFSEILRSGEAQMSIEEQGNSKALLVFCCGFVLARVLSGLSLVFLQPAKETGMLAAFAGAAQIKVVRGVLLLELGGIMGTMIGIDLKSGILAIGAAVLSFFYYVHVSKKEFGGITGDLAGYFVVICETAMVVVLGLCCVL